ncbi:c-type cytochrome [Neisseria chenwenguii]|uniref:Cytochrome C n=1 Tax=Neisseria chenwenguii TaxID=1853278 RepID=A0A220S2W0_9NEIS|nr:cytochrome c [Neisseria chenwenguii]ASK27831.1 cytochrome C [Neisseria chenwenguii]ROV56623.1 cytochrome C [Neisseria chenwenguii]
MKTSIFLTLAALALTACSGGTTKAKGPISEERSAAFKSMMPEFSEMGKMVKGETAYEVEKFKKAAAVFAESSKEPFKHFQSDPQGNGEALPAIWQDQAKFKAEEDKFRQAVEKLNTAAQGGNLEEIKAAYGEAGASCKSCHKSYRMPD